MTLDQYIDKQLKDPTFKEEWEKADPEFEIAKAIAEYRVENTYTQKQAAEQIGIDRADLNRLERKAANPTLRTLQKLAKAIGKNLVIKFI